VKNIFRRKSIIYFFMFCFLSSILVKAEEQPYLKNSNVMVSMNDGIRLATDIYTPKTGDKFPVILIRTPYKKENIGDFFSPYFYSNGYVVVIQDCRGKYSSEGTFIPIIHEKEDGLKTLDWIANQSWCNGKIGMWGASYLAYCALILAPENHPFLKTIVNISGMGDFYELLFPGGSFHLMAGLTWVLGNDERAQSSLKEMNINELFEFIPLYQAPDEVGYKGTLWQLMMDHPTYDRFWKDLGLPEKFSRINIPILHFTGWNDVCYRNTLSAYNGITRQAKQELPFQKLIVGPWHHDQQWSGKTAVGDEDFGQEAKMNVEKIMDLSVRWFDYWLKGIDNGITKEPPVKLFLMGKNKWIEAETWPPRNTKKQYLYLHSQKGANGLAGDGRLSLKKPAGKERDYDTFIFDPMNPVPTRGGVNFHLFPDNLGIKDQRPVETRKDVLVYTSDPFETEMEIIGPLKVILYASTEGNDTDFTAKLVEVRQDGYARIIEDGIIRGRFRNSKEKPQLMTPGKIYKLTIDLGSTAIRIDKGNRLRLEISSSNFPKYDRNPNTGEYPTMAENFEKVKQYIYHTLKYPSHIILLTK